ncbi:MAG: MFS transporter [Actinomycetota bacterium]
MKPSSDARTILAAQAVRAFAYGFGAVLLGTSLEARGYSNARAGIVLTGVVAGTALMSAVVGMYGDRIGRRRAYAYLYVALAATGVAFAFASAFWILFAVALTGAMSADIVESGPFTSLEQAMLPSAAPHERHARVFGTYNAIAALAGSIGALAAGGPSLLRQALHTHAPDQRWFLLFVPIGAAGAILAARLSDVVEPHGAAIEAQRRAPLRRSRATVSRLAMLFAVDSFAGGFVVQSFIAFWFASQFHASPATLGFVFFGAGLMQTASFLVAPRLAERVGLLNTMVFTHIPSNLLLAAIPLAPALPGAIALYMARQMLSQMDVPTRQAYIVALVDPDERTPAAAYTNTARYTTRPIGTLLSGVAKQAVIGLPFYVGGGIKTLYDLVLFAWFRRVPLATERSADQEDARG